MITKEYLHQLINSNAEENRWGEINQLISEENREVIENFLTDLLIYNKDLFKNTIVLNLIYALAHIRNTESIETILKIGIEFKDNVSVTNEVLDAIGDILAGQEYNPQLREATLEDADIISTDETDQVQLPDQSHKSSKREA